MAVFQLLYSLMFLQKREVRFGVHRELIVAQLVLYLALLSEQISLVMKQNKD